MNEISTKKYPIEKSRWLRVPDCRICGDMIYHKLYNDLLPWKSEYEKLDGSDGENHDK